MAVDPERRDRVVGRLAFLGDVRPRAMFGGAGLYLDGVMFGLLTGEGIVHFRSDEATRAMFEAAGSEAFRPFPDRPMRMPYHRVPDAVFDDDAVLREWAESAIAAARRAAAAKRRIKPHPFRRRD